MPIQKLNFPEYSFDIRIEGQKKLIFDKVRKKFIPLTPEEWVRQNAVEFLKDKLQVKPSNIAVERELKFNTRKKRFDILVFSSGVQPLCIVECKAPDVVIDSNTLLQAAVYNKSFHCPWLWLTNGINHYWLKFENGNIMPASEPLHF